MCSQISHFFFSVGDTFPMPVLSLFFYAAFCYANLFNTDVSKWETGKVTTMEYSKSHPEKPFVVIPTFFF